MPLPLALPVALSAIQSLVKFRGRLDTILSLNQTTAGLPFALPPVPTDDAPHVQPMLAFFGASPGRDILEIRGLVAEWEAVSPNPFAGPAQQSLGRLLRAYYESCDVRPESLGPSEDSNRTLAAKGPGREMRLAYYIVESERLSRNPAATRVLLAAADTLLEFGGENASLFIAHPRTRALVESLLTEFAVKRDWDDAGTAQIFKTLLGSAVVATLEHPGNCADKPVARVLFAALGDLQTSMGADFVAKLVTRDGFQALIGRCLVCAADEPALLPDQPVLQETLAAMLREAGENIEGLLGQPGALAGVLERGIHAAATAVVPLIDRKVAGQPLLAVVLKTALGETEKAAAGHTLFAQIADGRFFAALYGASLQSVADNPAALATQAKLRTHVAALIAACAGELGKIEGGEIFSVQTLRTLTIRALEVVGEQPEFLRRHGEFTGVILRAAITSSARALKDGFTTDDLFQISDAVVRMAAANPNLVQLDERFQVVVTAFAHPLANEGLAAVATAARRKELFFTALESLTANPTVWGELAEREMIEPLVAGILRALATNPGGILSGPPLIPVFQQTLEAAARRGRALIDEKTTPAALEVVITAALVTAEGAVGVSIDGRTLPDFLRDVVRSFLAAPFDPEVEQTLHDWLKQRLPVAA